MTTPNDDSQELEDRLAQVPFLPTTTPNELTREQDYWIVKFEDTGVHDLVYSDEESARQSFKSHSESWSCHLFCHSTILDALRARVVEMEQQVKLKLQDIYAPMIENGKLSCVIDGKTLDLADVRPFGSFNTLKAQLAAMTQDRDAWKDRAENGSP